MGRFSNKVVVVTGGSSGIGLAAAREFVKEGAKVVVTGRTTGTLAEATKELGEGAVAVQADVSKPADLDRLYAQVKEKFGKIDVLFANAGVAKVAPAETTSEAMFDEIVDTNFRGAFFTVQKALPILRDGGAIVFTTSYFDTVGTPGTSVVSATKAAVRSLTRTLAAELLHRNIRVNTVSPGVVETPLFGKLGVSAEQAGEIGKALLQQIPFKRFGTPEEIAKAVTFLASDDASYITGTELSVDGGRTQI